MCAVVDTWQVLAWHARHGTRISGYLVHPIVAGDRAIGAAIAPNGDAYDVDVSFDRFPLVPPSNCEYFGSHGIGSATADNLCALVVPMFVKKNVARKRSRHGGLGHLADQDGT